MAVPAPSAHAHSSLEVGGQASEPSLVGDLAPTTVDGPGMASSVVDAEIGGPAVDEGMTKRLLLSCLLST